MTIEPVTAKRSWKPFAWFFLGMSASSLGMWMLRLVQTLIALDVSGGSATAVGITVMLQFVPALLLSVGIGALADRFGAAKLLLLGQVAMISATVIEAVLSATGSLTLGWSFVFAVGFGLGAAVDTPLRMTVIPSLVGSTQIQRAVSLSMLANQTTRMAGPALAAIVLVRWGDAGVLAVCALCIAVFVPILGVISRRERARAALAGHRDGGSIREGLAHLRGRPDLVVTFIAVGVGGLIGPNLPVIATLMASGELALGAYEIGIANAVIACGTVLGVVVSAWIPVRNPRPIIVVAAITGLTGGLVSLATDQWTLFALLVPAGATALIMLTLGSAYLQMTIDDEYRSRVTAVFSVVLIAGAPIMSPILGAASDLVGARIAIAASGAIVAVSCATLFLVHRRPSDDRIDLVPTADRPSSTEE